MNFAAFSTQISPFEGAMPAVMQGSDPCEERLRWLLESVPLNRFLPEPEPTSVFVGDGDFRAIGAEYLGHLVRLGGLKPQHCVLDIGSGIGRIAIPLTQYLDGSATYLGLDPTRPGIEWCCAHVTTVYPGFRFKHLDVQHPLYNPDGILRGASLVLPVGDRSIDFALMVSVVTHLPPEEVVVYAREVARVLKPGGRLLVSSFIMDKGAQVSEPKDARRNFAREGDGPAWYVDAVNPYGAVGFDEGWLDATLEAAGLRIERRSLGHWRGIPSAHYQDITVASRGAST